MTISAAFALLLVFIAGYASQRGRTCAVSAAFEIAKQRRARRFTGFLFAAACSLMVLSLVSLFTPSVFVGFASHWPSRWTFMGAIVFAIGAWVNGRCSLGTIARLGSGDLSRIGTLIGIFAGIVIAISALPPVMMAKTEALPLLANVSPTARIGFAVLNLFVMALLLRKTVPAGFNSAQWPIWQSMAIIGIINGLLVWLLRDWSYTRLFGNIFRRDTDMLPFGILIFTVLICGATAAAVVSKQWQLSAGNVRDWSVAIGGGMLMGLGLSLVPGGNDTMLLVGLPLMLPHLIAGYLTVYATLMTIALLTPKR